jgi:hypothetical protein
MLGCQETLTKTLFIMKKFSLSQGLPLEKHLITVIIVSVLLVSALAGVLFVELAQANPIMNFYSDVSPPEGAQPPIIIIHTPTNGSSHPDDVTLAFDVAVPRITGDGALNAVTKIYYEASWVKNEIIVAEQRHGSFSIDLSDMRSGSHSVTIYAVGVGYIQTGEEFHEEGNIVWSYNYYDKFEMTGYSTVSFIKDRIPPKITVSNPQNRTYDTSNVELDFTVSEAASEILYCLDGKENQTITGNTTLTGLENGAHNVTLYASDLAGNNATPKTLHFTVAAFPVVPIVAAIATAAVSCGLGLLIYFKKRVGQETLTKKRVL